MKITYTFAKRVVMVANSYLDFVSDTILLSAILNSLEYSLEPTKFASQVGLILLVSLIFPLLLSAITIAYKKPLVIVNYFIWSHFKETASAKKNKLILVCRIIIILFFPMVPALILFASEEAIDNRNRLKTEDLRNDKNNQAVAIEKSKSLTEFINICRLSMLTVKRNELSLELVIQMSIHLTMVLLSETEYPIESGLQAVFQDANASQEDSIFWSE